MYIKKLNEENLITIIFALLPVIDSINGFLIVNNIFSIGSGYKMSAVLLLFLIIIYRDSLFSIGSLRILFSVCGFIGISILFNLFLGYKITNADFPIKMVFNIALFIVFCQLIKNDAISGKAFYQILNISSSLMIFCILLPYIFGMGYKIYAGGIGYKGFFYSQNELNAVLLILFFFCLYKVLCEVNLCSIFQLIGISLCLLLTNTKSSMVACAFGYLVFIIEYFRRKESKHKLFAALFLIICILFASNFIRIQFFSFLRRQTSLFQTYNNSLFSALVSGRNFYLTDAWNSLLSSPFISIHILIGNGFCSPFLVEMDFLDIFFYLGIIGILLFFSFGMYIYKRSAIHFKNDGTIIRKFSFLLIIAFAALTGHVLFMATSGCYFIIMCCFNMTYDNKFRGETRC